MERRLFQIFIEHNLGEQNGLGPCPRGQGMIIQIFIKNNKWFKEKNGVT